MKYDKAAMTLLFVFLVSLLILIISSFVPFLKGRIYADDLESLILNILKIYSVPLAIFLAANFFRLLESGQGSINPKIFLTALSLCCLWNLILLAGTVMLLFIKPVEDFEEVIKFQQGVSGDSSFIITGILSFLFIGKTKEST